MGTWLSAGKELYEDRNDSLELKNSLLNGAKSITQNGPSRATSLTERIAWLLGISLNSGKQAMFFNTFWKRGWGLCGCLLRFVSGPGFIDK